MFFPLSQARNMNDFLFLLLAHELTHAWDFEQYKAAKIPLDPTLLTDKVNIAQGVWLEYRAEFHSFRLLRNPSHGVLIGSNPLNYTNNVDTNLIQVIRLMGRMDASGVDWKTHVGSAFPTGHATPPIAELATLHDCLIQVCRDIHGYLQIAKVLDEHPALWTLSGHATPPTASPS
jgi:hypothetical protein